MYNNHLIHYLSFFLLLSNFIIMKEFWKTDQNDETKLIHISGSTENLILTRVILSNNMEYIVSSVDNHYFTLNFPSSSVTFLLSFNSVGQVTNSDYVTKNISVYTLSNSLIEKTLISSSIFNEKMCWIMSKFKNITVPYLYSKTGNLRNYALIYCITGFFSLEEYRDIDKRLKEINVGETKKLAQFSFYDLEKEIKLTVSPNQINLNMMNSDIFTELKKRPINISVCQISDSPGQIPLIIDYACEEHSQKKLDQHEIMNMSYWKIDNSNWETDSCECFTETWNRYCTVWFWGTETKSEEKFFIPTPLYLCESLCKGESPPSGEMKAVGTTGLYSTTNIPNWPCAWTGGGTETRNNYFVVRSAVSIRHSDASLISSVVNAGSCLYRTGNCTTHKKGQILWKPTSDKFFCNYVKGPPRACSVLFSGCGKESNFSITCPDDNSYHTVSKAQFFVHCDKKEYATITDQGLMISLWNNSNRCIQWNELMKVSETIPPKETYGYKFYTTNSLYQSQLNYLSNWINNKNWEMIHMTHLKECRRKQQMMRLAIDIGQAASNWVAEEITGIKNVVGYIKGTVLYYYTCQNTNIFRILKNHSCDQYIKVEYALEHSTGIGRLSTTHLKIIIGENLKKCKVNMTQYLPWGLGKILKVNSSHANIEDSHWNFLDQTSLTNPLIFKSRPLYSVEELTGALRWESEIANLGKQIEILVDHLGLSKTLMSQEVVKIGTIGTQLGLSIREKINKFLGSTLLSLIEIVEYIVVFIVFVWLSYKILSFLITQLLYKGIFLSIKRKKCSLLKNANLKSTVGRIKKPFEINKNLEDKKNKKKKGDIETIEL